MATGLMSEKLWPHSRRGFSFHQIAPTGFVAHTISHSVRIWDSFPGFKRLRREAYHSPTSHAKVKNDGTPHFHPHIYRHGVAETILNCAL